MLGQRQGGGPGPEHHMAGTSGRLAAHSGRLTKDTAAKKASRGRRRRQESSALTTRLVGHCHT